MANPLEQLINSLSPEKRAILATMLQPAPEPVAIIGMSCRFPGGANSPEEFWRLLQQGKDGISEIPANRWDWRDYYDPDPGAANKMHTRWGGFVDDIAGFDAAFFGIVPEEARSMDPQQRLLLEVTWEALEHAGLAADRLTRTSTGVFIGIINDDYTHFQIQGLGLAACLNNPYFGIGSSSSMAGGRLSYILDLQGPNVSLDTACSSSLVATHLACQALRNRECDLALAGGVHAILMPDVFINLCKMNMLANDGRCKTFDAAANGFAMGEGCGIVVLKRLSDALKHGDPIIAVIRGSAVNEDGRSSSPTAPNGLAQQAVIRQALTNAGLTPDQVQYVEAHGTGTPLGDPIEVEALHTVLGKGRAAQQRLLVGAVKTNIGHLAAAAGVAGLIKTALALQHGLIPPSLNLRTPNPAIPWHAYALDVVTQATPWPSTSGRRIAGVSSFGWSGTNSHAVLEAPPERQPSGPSRPYQLLLLSAKSETALETLTGNLGRYLAERPDLKLADVAYTLQLGRSSLSYRRAVLCRDRDEAIELLRNADSQRSPIRRQTLDRRPLAFLFPGVGDQYVGMGRALYASEPQFRATVDECCALLQPLLGQDLRALLYPEQPAPSAPAPSAARPDLRALLGRNTASSAASASPLHQTDLAHPVVFVVAYALAQLLRSWGIQPQALLGYSLGEYVAACVSGVLSLEDALRLVATRAKLIQALPAGGMLAVMLSEDEIQPYLGAGVSLAAVNSPSTSVLAGSPDALAAVKQRLEAAEIVTRPVEASHAFHTSALVPVAAEMTTLLASMTLRPPQIPYVSNLTGTWITAEQATDPAYWAAQMCQPVRFAEGVAALLAQRELALLEVGPGQALGSFVRQHPDCSRERTGLVFATLRAAHETVDDQANLLQTLGKLWQVGVSPDWNAFYRDEQRQRVALPTYPFERRRFWIDPVKAAVPEAQPASSKRADIADWFYQPVWKPAPLPTPFGGKGRWLVFSDSQGVAARLVEQLRRTGHTVIEVWRGAHFARRDDTSFQLCPTNVADYHALANALQLGAQTLHVVHLWSLDQIVAEPGVEQFRAAQELGYYSLLFLVQALGTGHTATPVQLLAVSDGMQAVAAEECPAADYAPLAALCMVINQEQPTIRCRSIDVRLADNDASLAERLVQEAQVRGKTLPVAYRNGVRLEQDFTPLRLEASPPVLRPRGVYLITGGLGGVGLLLAEHLARSVQARLVLLTRSALPPREQWADWLANNPSDERISVQLRQVQLLEELGAEVLLCQADVADPLQLGAAIASAEAQFGPLNGVLHAAGVTSQQSFVPTRTLAQEQCEAHFRPKAYGLYALESALGARPLDFCLLFSSLSVVLGGLGFGAYAAANSFMDAFAQRHNRSHATPWISVAWDAWRVQADQAGRAGATLAQYEMLPAEGAVAFERVIAVRTQARIVNSTGDLAARMRQWLPSDEPSSAVAASETVAALALSLSEYEQRIAAIWQDVLGRDQIGLNDNFFDLGGNSLNGLQVVARLKQEFNVQLPAVALFEAPTVGALARYLRPAAPQQVQQSAEQVLQQRRAKARQANATHDIAIISMVGRFPGAATIEQLWQNVCAGVESITTFSEAELLAAGIDPLLIQNPNYVPAKPILDDVAHFDAAFFGYTPREAELMDPQQRLFHECAWEALELAGYDTRRYKGLIGVFAGSNLNFYMLRMATDPSLVTSITDNVVLENDKDALATNISYRLNLRGPSFAVQTFCSTSLVAVHLACRSLLMGECDMALAGGVSVRVPVQEGYLYKQGDQVSPDGHCRTFDAQAEGTIFGDGVGIVVLKRLADALEDGDTIHAIIKSSAINNDGDLKVGYTAPSVVGQAEVIVSALERAGIDPASIGYVEAHGTATKLGDPIEVAALTKAYRSFTERKNYCAIGSVKTNIGHLDRAAGVTGLIKAVMSVKHGLIPPLLHFKQPNPEIDFENSPFFVPTELRSWPEQGSVRRAAVNSLGVGGTNAHVIVEAAPLAPAPAPSREAQLLVLSARTPAALERAAAQLHDFLRDNPDLPLADVAYTLQVGRRVFEHRRMLVCPDREEACRLLRSNDATRVFNLAQKPVTRPLAFLFPGVGDQYVGMGRALYASEPQFRATVDECCALLQPLLGQDLRVLLFPEQPAPSAPAPSAARPDLRALLGRNTASSAASASPLHQTDLAHPAVFVVAYALAQLLRSWGIQPQALLGYSLGEYVAACVSGVLSLEDALRLVATRAKLIQALPAGGMLAVMLSEDEIQPYLGAGVSLAAVNSPNTCVLAGAPDALVAVQKRLEAAEIVTRPVEASHAFHTSALAPVAAEMTTLLASVTLRPPQIPYVSNLTGTWITAEQATDPAYWAAQMCQPVRFAEGVATLLAQRELVLLEVGPGQALGSFVRQHPDCSRERMSEVLGTLRGRHEQQGDLPMLLHTLGRLWLLDVPIDWAGFYANEQRQRIPLPTYPFERQRYWLEAQPGRGASVGSPARRSDPGEWFTTPSWKRSTLPSTLVAQSQPAERACWLLFLDACGVGDYLAAQLTAQGQQVICVTPGASFARFSPQRFSLRPQQREDYVALLHELNRDQQLPDQIVHLWMVTPLPTQADTGAASVNTTLNYGFYSLLGLTQALGDQGVERCCINIVSSNMQEVTGSETIEPLKATLIGPTKVIPQEHRGMRSRSIDIVLAAGGGLPDQRVLHNLLAELNSAPDADLVALRGPHRWVQIYEPVYLPAVTRQPRLREGGVYLITGGLGGIGLAMAEALVDTVGAKVVLLGRSALPPQEQWAEILATQDQSSGLARRIKLVQQLSARSEVLLLQADVSDPAQVQRAVAQALERFGTINGVLHLAGVPGMGMIQLKSKEAAASVLAPKVQGTLALSQALRDIPLDFLVLFSSVATVTGGGPGQVDYCAANAFMEAYARANAQCHGYTVAISWGEWRWDAWQEGLQGYPEAARAFLVASRRAYGLSFEEGAEALRRVLASNLSTVVVTSQDVQTLIEQSSGNMLDTLLGTGQQQDQERTRYPRPALGTSYVEPRNQMESTLVGIWSAVLGIEQVGINDNFFELGGNSLVGVDLIGRVRRTLNLETLPVHVLYEAPSVAALAAYISNQGQLTLAEDDETELEDRGERRREQLDFLQRRAQVEEEEVV